MQVKKIINYRYTPLISGIVFIGAGIFPLLFGKAALFMLTLFFSLALLLSGFIEVAFSVVNRKTMTLWSWSLASGMISFIFGVMLLVNPFVSMAALALCVGFAVLFRSIGGIILSINLKKKSIEKDLDAPILQLS